jgi:hypothetical protein
MVQHVVHGCGAPKEEEVILGAEGAGGRPGAVNLGGQASGEAWLPTVGASRAAAGVWRRPRRVHVDRRGKKEGKGGVEEEKKTTLVSKTRLGSLAS